MQKTYCLTTLPLVRLILFLISYVVHAFAPAAESTTQRHWQRARDEVYLQEVGRKISAPSPLTSVAVYEGKVYAGSAKGLHEVMGNELADIAAVRTPVQRLVVAGGSLWAMTSEGLLRFQNGSWNRVSGEAVNDLCEHLGEVVVAQQNRLWRVGRDALEPLVKAESPFPVSRVISHCETLYLQGAGRLTFVEGQRIGGQDV